MNREYIFIHKSEYDDDFCDYLNKANPNFVLEPKRVLRKVMEEIEFTGWYILTNGGGNWIDSEDCDKYIKFNEMEMEEKIQELQTNLTIVNKI